MIITRPPELQEFYNNHGFTLEIGLYVRFKDSDIESTVEGIRFDRSYNKVLVDIDSDGSTGHNISPLDLTPI